MLHEMRLQWVQRYVGCLVFAVWAGFGGFSLSSHGAEVARELGRIRTDRLRETSGLAVSRQNPDVLWLHNDGAKKHVFAVRTDGRLAARLNVRAKFDDIEDIAIGLGPEPGVDFIYLGDIGDNNADRREIRVIRVPEPTLSKTDDEELKIKDPEVFRLRYPDGPHDAEALMIDAATGDLFIATKQQRGARLYRAAVSDLGSEGVTNLELVGYLNVDDISGGDISRTGDWIMLRSEDRGWLWARTSGEDVAAAMQRTPVRVLTRGSEQGKNGEAVGFSPDGRGYFTVSEGKQEAAYYFPIVSEGTDD
jgi:hypothetical protein